MGKFQDVANVLIAKGSQTMNDLGSAAGDAATKAKLKIRLKDLSLEQDVLMKKLGYAAYEKLEGDAAFVEANAGLFKKIQDTKGQIDALQKELDASDAPSADGGSVEASGAQAGTEESR